MCSSYNKLSTELANIDLLLLGENRVRVLAISGYIGNNHLMLIFVLCVFLLKGTLFNIYSFVNTQHKANSTILSA